MDIILGIVCCVSVIVPMATLCFVAYVLKKRK